MDSDAAPAADVLERQNSVAPPPEPPSTPPPTSSPETPSLTLVDLQGMVALIAVACERGTFRPTELSAVGKLHDRLSAYLKAQTPPPQ